jgi:hypothetical protein
VRLSIQKPRNHLGRQQENQAGNKTVDVKSAPHAKHTASRIAGLTHVARALESGSVPVNFPWNWQRMKTVR